MNGMKLLCSSLLLVLYVSCGNENKSADFLQKYESESIGVREQDNRIGVFIDDASNMGNSFLIRLNFKNINIKKSIENLDVLSKRFFVADALLMFAILK